MTNDERRIRILMQALFFRFAYSGGEAIGETLFQARTLFRAKHVPDKIALDICQTKSAMASPLRS